MKYLVVIALVALLLFLLYRRLRPYLKRAGEFLNILRQVQRTFTEPSANRGGAGEKLVQCARCGIWIPVTRALAARSGAEMFCSADCLSSGNA